MFTKKEKFSNKEMEVSVLYAIASMKYKDAVKERDELRYLQECAQMKCDKYLNGDDNKAYVYVTSMSDVQSYGRKIKKLDVQVAYWEAEVFKRKEIYDAYRCGELVD